MYKVFVNDKPIILTDSLKSDKQYSRYNFSDTLLDQVILELDSNTILGVYLYCSNLQADWLRFQKLFKVRCAAGGLVLNQEQEVLFIFRDGKWDLPKGGIESGETVVEAALREVEEECGISHLKIKAPLLKTYHIFTRKNKQYLKITDWFLMESCDAGILTPQLEEGITQVVFKLADEVPELLNKSYANIRLVYQRYLDLHA